MFLCRYGIQEHNQYKMFEYEMQGSKIFRISIGHNYLLKIYDLIHIWYKK